MHSKVYPWDFRENSHGYGKSPLLIQAGDEYVQRQIILKLKKNRQWNVKQSSEVTASFLEERMFSTGLFQEEENILVYFREDGGAHLKEFFSSVLIPRVEDVSDLSRLILVFSKKSSALYKDLIKSDKMDRLSILEPPFWEGRKLFDFFVRELGLELSQEEKHLVFSTTEANSENFFNLLSNIKTACLKEDSAEDRLSYIKGILPVADIDQFELASFYGNKRFKPFFESVSQAPLNFESFRSLCSFMQTHLIKLADPTYIKAKAKPSQYDKKILSESKLWKSEELKRSLRFFGELEVLAKSKNREIFDRLRRLKMKLK